MGKISVLLSNELEEKFRKKAMRKFGMRKGYLSKAMEEAVRSWLKES